MKETLERLLKENLKMMEEIREIPNGDYQTGYIQALLNTKSLLEYELSIVENQLQALIPLEIN